jgi:hypothetical protein
MHHACDPSGIASLQSLFAKIVARSLACARAPSLPPARPPSSLPPSRPHSLPLFLPPSLSLSLPPSFPPVAFLRYLRAMIVLWYGVDGWKSAQTKPTSLTVSGGLVTCRFSTCEPASESFVCHSVCIAHTCTPPSIPPSFAPVPVGCLIFSLLLTCAQARHAGDSTTVP